MVRRPYMPGATNDSEEERVSKRNIRTAGFVAVMAVALLSACGGDDGDPSAEVASLGTETPASAEASAAPESSIPTDPEEAQLAFAQCMREHGIDMPDPGQSGGGMLIQRDEGDA